MSKHTIAQLAYIALGHRDVCDLTGLPCVIIYSNPLYLATNTGVA